ncbi:hypothetical protein GW17_00034755 [Ensete ventricosum]|nr:hypothetical protein GW17_00034755 [Ensete ventricosum]
MSTVGSRIASFLGSAAARFGKVPWREIREDAFDRAVLVLKAACFVHVVNTYVVGIAFVSPSSAVRGPSMLPTINLTGDVVAVERVSPRRGSLAVGDVVILLSPENPRKTVAKRVLGLEGDAVTFVVDPARGSASQTVVVFAISVRTSVLSLSRYERRLGLARGDEASPHPRAGRQDNASSSR